MRAIEKPTKGDCPSRSLMMALILVLAVATTAGAAITQVPSPGSNYTSTAIALAANGTSTLPINMTGVDLVVLFAQSSDGGGVTTHRGSSATLNGANMTLVTSNALGESKNGSHYACEQIFYFANTANLTGSQNIVFRTPNAMSKLVLSAAGFTGVDKTNPVVSSAFFKDFSNKPVNVTLTTITDSMVLFGCVQDSSISFVHTPSVSVSMSGVSSSTVTPIRAEAYKIVAPAASQTVGFTVGSSTAGVTGALVLRARDITPPTLPASGGIVRASTNPTNAASVNYTVTFTEPVNGVSTSDFALTTTGAVSGASVASVTPVTTSQYTVAVNTGSGSGTLRLDIPAGATITDNAGNVFVGPYTSGEVYTLDKDAPTGTISILNGAEYTNSENVTINVTSSDASAQMQFSNMGYTWSAYENFSATKTWTLVDTDGPRTVYCHLRDAVGNESTLISDTITLDQTAPVGDVSINGGAFLTKLTSVTLTLSATDAHSGLAAMQFSIDAGSWTSPIPYNTSAPYTIRGLQGQNSVYVRYTDVAGNVSNPFRDTIIYDTTGPSVNDGSVVINGGAPTTNSLDVTLTLNATDTYGDVTYASISNDNSTWTRVSYAATVNWQLASPDGTKTVYVKFEDTLGNESAVADDDIVLDTTKPTGTLTINNGDLYTNNRTVSLALSASETVASVQFSSDNATWGAWEDFAASKSFLLPQDDGSKTVYANFRDASGNVSEAAISDDITLDQTPPTGTIIIAGGVTAVSTNSVDLTLSATDALSGVAKMRFSNDLASWSDWQDYATTMLSWELSPGDAQKTVYAQYQDAAGNDSALDGSADSIIVDTQKPPAPTVSVVSLTNDPKPEWTWVSNDNVTPETIWRFQLNGESGDWTEISETRFKAYLNLTDGDYTLYVQERDAAGNWSDSDSATVTIDTQAPAAPVVDGPVLTRNLQPTWTWVSGSDDGIKQFRAQVDAETEDAWISTTAFSFAQDAPFDDDTSHTLYVQERDAAGNWSTSGYFTTAVDKDAITAPTVTGVTPTNDTTPQWTWVSGGGLQQYRFQFNAELNDGWTNTTATAWEPTEALAEGTYTLYVQERLSSVMWSESGSFAITVDTTAPNPPGVTGPEVTNDPTPEWDWTPGDDTGNGQYQYNIDNGPWIDTQDLLYIPDEDLPEGEHTVCVRSSDQAGNWSEPECYTVTIDLTAPAAPIVVAPGLTASKRPNWTWTSGGMGGNGTFRYQFNSQAGDWIVGAFQSFTPEADLAEGDYTLYVQERDDAGNWSASGSKLVQVRPSAPGAPTVNCPSLTNNPQPAWTWTGSNGSGTFRYQLDSETGEWTTTTQTTFTPATPLSGGLHTLYVQEQSLAGVWSASGFKSAVIDLTPPGAPTVTGPMITGSKRPTWSWTTGGGGNGQFRYQLGGTTGSWIETGQGQFTPNADLTSGSHTLYVQERDEAGNWSQSGSFSVNVSQPTAKAPLVLGPTFTANQRPMWTWSSGGGGNGRYRFQMNSQSGTWIQTTAVNYRSVEPMADGPYVLYVQEQDQLGNWSPSGSWGITIDNVAPNPPVVTGATPTTNTRPTWTWTSGGGGGNGTYRAQLDGEDDAWFVTTALTFSPSSPLFKNAHTLYVQERDVAGNWSASALYVIVIDPQAVNPPIVTGPEFTGNATPTWTWTSAGGGTGRYRYRLDGGAAVTATVTSFTPASALANGAHTLEVQEANSFGDWSWPGSFTVTINDGLPLITLVGQSTVDVSAGSTYTDAGATARDANGVDITDNLVTSGLPVDTNVVGSYTIRYNAKDDAGTAAAEVTRTVNVVAGVTDVTIVAPLGGSTIFMPGTGATALVALTSVAPEGTQSVTYSFDGAEVGTATTAPWVVVLELTPDQALYGEHTLTAATDGGETASTDEVNVNIAALPQGADVDANGLPDNPFYTLSSGDLWIQDGVAMMRIDSGMPVPAGAANVVTLANPDNVEQRMMANVSNSVLAEGQTGIIVVKAASDLTALLGAGYAARVAALPQGMQLATPLYATVNIAVTENNFDFWNLDSETLSAYPISITAQDGLSDGASLFVYPAFLVAPEANGLAVGVLAGGEWGNEAVLDYVLEEGAGTASVNGLGLFAILQSSGEGEGEGEPAGCFAGSIDTTPKFNGDSLLLFAVAALLLPAMRMRARSVTIR